MRRAHHRWLEKEGDRTLRLDYPLCRKSIVIDAGGFKGDFAQSIDTLFHPEVHVFEPVAEYANHIRRRLPAPNIHVHARALGASDSQINLSLSQDASSQFISGTHQVTVPVVDVVEVLDGMRDKIALLKLNVEGGEYDILERLITSGRISNIDFLQIQFHDFAPGAKARRRRIRQNLKATHSCDWNYPWIWESWSRRRASPK